MSMGCLLAIVIPSLVCGVPRSSPWTSRHEGSPRLALPTGVLLRRFQGQAQQTWAFLRLDDAGAATFAPLSLVNKAAYRRLAALHTSVFALVPSRTKRSVNANANAMSTTAQLKLMYYDGTGRAELSRLLFVLGGIGFTDQRVRHADMAALKPQLPLGQVPVLEVDGTTFLQSFAIARYAAHRGGLYPHDPVEALCVDMVSETLRDLLTVFIALYSESDADKKNVATIKFLEQTVPSAFRVLEALVRGDFFLSDDRVSLADVHLFDFAHNALVPVFQFSLEPFPKLENVCEREGKRWCCSVSRVVEEAVR